MVYTLEQWCLKYANGGFAVTGMVVEAAGAFAASRSNERLEFSFLLGALIGLVGTFVGTLLCLKFAFAAVSTMVVVLMVVLIASVLVGELLRWKNGECVL
jgi:ABC-type Mn2+/Zn2+ transport system permease subunit